MNIFKEFEARIEEAIRALQARSVVPASLPLDAVRVEPPKDTGHGDLSTNAAMVLAKPAKMAPRQIAEPLAEELGRQDDVASVEIAGPGFINIRLAASIWPTLVRAILNAPDDYGRADLGQAKPVNVEFVSANPTGPLHVGHCRGAVFGDALARLLSFTGYDVCREYYINDAGTQVDVLARSAYLRYREALGEAIGTIPEGLYPGDYLIPVGVALAETHGKALLDMPESEWLPIVRKHTITMMMDGIRADLAKLDIGFDVFFSERSLTEGEKDEVAATIAWLEARGLVYVGRLPPPKGKLPDDWEDREQTLFRATEFGDDIDRALKKSDGGYTYFASDMAYHRNKFERGFKALIDVWGADHGGYVKRLEAAVRALTDGQARLDVKICQLVRLFRAGTPVKMSKRAGEFVTLREIVDEVGADAFRFMMLYRKNDAPLDFDFVKVTEQSRDNPVFYVQYAHARAYSVFRNVADVFADLANPSASLADAPIELLSDQAEIQVIRRLSQYPRVIEAASEAHEPHRIAFYLYDLASDFHSLWTRGKESPQLRFINPDNKSMTRARMAMVWAVANVLASGLRILGVQAIREMR